MKRFAQRLSQWDEDVEFEKQLDGSLAFTLKSPAGRFHASSVGHDARRLLVHYLGLHSEKISAHQARRFRLGNAIHSAWENDLHKANMLVAAERRLVSSPTQLLHGRLDFVVRLQLDGHQFLMELKSRNNREFETLKEPDFLTVVQWAVYSERENLEDGFVVYENTDTSDVLVFRALRQGSSVLVYRKGIKVAEWPGLLTQLHEKLDYVVWCADNKAIPERCFECRVQQKCQLLEACELLERERRLVTLEQWKNERNIRPSLAENR